MRGGGAKQRGRGRPITTMPRMDGNRMESGGANRYLSNYSPALLSTNPPFGRIGGPDSASRPGIEARGNGMAGRAVVHCTASPIASVPSDSSQARFSSQAACVCELQMKLAAKEEELSATIKSYGTIIAMKNDTIARLAQRQRAIENEVSAVIKKRKIDETTSPTADNIDNLKRVIAQRSIELRDERVKNFHLEKRIAELSETNESTTLRLLITKLSGIRHGQPIRSQPLKFGGLNWEINAERHYVKGVDCLRIVLKTAIIATYLGPQCAVMCAARIFHCKDKSKGFQRSDTFRFNSDETIHGWDNFIRWEDLMAFSSGRNDDSINIEMSLKVFPNQYV